MKRLTKKQKTQIKVNVWAVVAYTLSIFSYVAFAIGAFYVATENGCSPLSGYAGSSATGPQGTSVSSAPAVHALGIFVGYVVTVIMVGVAMCMIVAFPYILSKYYSRGLRKLLGVVYPRHKAQDFFYAKTIATILPLGGFLIVALIDSSFSNVFVVCFVIATILVFLAEACLYLQWSAVHRHKLADKYVW